MYTSVSQRYIKQKQFDAANELLVDGCLKMLKHEQYGSVIDLIDRLLSLLGSMNLDLNDVQTMNNITEIVSAFPVEDQQFEPFIMKIIKWARQESVKVHHLVATIHFKLGNYYDAEYHYVRGDKQSAIMLGRMEYEFSLDKQQQDPGYFILRAVGALLLQAKLEEAEAAYREFIRMSEWDNSQMNLITDHPLLNFTTILVQVVKNQDLESFCKATSLIQQTLSIDNYLVQVC